MGERGAIRIVVTGTPVAWSRAGTNQGRHFTKPHVRRWQDDLRMLARQEMQGRALLEEPLVLTVRDVFQATPGWPTWKRHLLEQGLLAHTAVPDLDNLVKIVKDALNGIVWRDDRQVVRQLAEKQYGPTPLVEVRVQVVPKAPSSVKRRADAKNFIPEEPPC